jgi:heme A synthase
MQHQANTPQEAAPGLERAIARVALALVVLTYALMVLGAVVRAIHGGLSCPDWPLCHGQYFPPFDPILSEANPPTPAQMNAEWFHRLVAGLVSVGFVGLAGLVWKSGRRDLRNLAVVAFVTLAAQVAMGAATVFLGNIHYSVAIHLALATILLLSLSWIGRTAAGPGHLADWLPGDLLPDGLRKQAYFALGLLGTTMIVGAVVATTPGANLVCPAFPACGREDYSGVGGLVTLQMLHRILALTFAAWALALAWNMGGFRAYLKGVLLVAGLTLTQVTLGILNVYFEVPAAVSAAHLGTSVAMFFVLFHWSARGSHASH